MPTASTPGEVTGDRHIVVVVIRLVDRLLGARSLFLLGRLLITFMYWYAGLGFLLNLAGAIEMMRGFGLEPAPVIAALTILTQLVGSALVIDGRLAWLGAGLLGFFTLMTIPLVHDFWNMTGPAVAQARLESEEHLTVVGGLIIVSILCWRDRQRLRPGATV